MTTADCIIQHHGRYSRTSYDISEASDWSRWPSRPIRSLRYNVTCTRIPIQHLRESSLFIYFSVCSGEKFVHISLRILTSLNIWTFPQDSFRALVKIFAARIIGTDSLICLTLLTLTIFCETQWPWPLLFSPSWLIQWSTGEGVLHNLFFTE